MCDCTLLFFFLSVQLSLRLAAINSFLISVCICAQIFVFLVLVLLYTINCKKDNLCVAYVCSTVNTIMRQKFLHFVKITKIKIISTHLYVFKFVTRSHEANTCINNSDGCVLNLLLYVVDALSEINRNKINNSCVYCFGGKNQF